MNGRVINNTFKVFVFNYATNIFSLIFILNIGLLNYQNEILPKI